MVYAYSFLHDDMDVDDVGDITVINPKLWKPREKLIKALCNQRYGHKYWSATEQMEVIRENELSLYKDGKNRTEKQVKDAMAVAYEKLQTQ